MSDVDAPRADSTLQSVDCDGPRLNSDRDDEEDDPFDDRGQEADGDDEEDDPFDDRGQEVNDDAKIDSGNTRKEEHQRP